MSTQRRTLTLVGNGEIARNLSRSIDSSDFVVRFNACRNYGGPCGTRLDALCLTNTGQPARLFSRKGYFNALPFFPAIAEIWIPRDVRVHKKYNDLYLEAGGDPALPEPLSDRTRQILAANFSDLTVCRFGAATNEAAFLTLSVLSTTAFVMPSTGYLALMHALTATAWTGYEIRLAGFSFTGWQGHPWAAERAAVAALVKQKRLRILA